MRYSVLASMSGALMVLVPALFARPPSAVAQTRHHHHQVVRHQIAPAPGGAATSLRDPNAFYPNEIEGGVSGNLPFNNQIRKLRDPLNANGAGR